MTRMKRRNTRDGVKQSRNYGARCASSRLVVACSGSFVAALVTRTALPHSQAGWRLDSQVVETAVVPLCFRWVEGQHISGCDLFGQSVEEWAKVFVGCIG